MSDKPRPILVTFLAILWFLSALLCLFAVLATIFAIVPAVICFIIGFGFWKGWSIMWWIGMIVSVIGILASLAVIVMSFDITFIVSLAINVIIVWYLRSPKVENFFRG